MQPKRSLLHRIFSSKPWRLVQLATGVHRIHHMRWSFGFAFPVTNWCWFEPYNTKDPSGERVVVVEHGWQRCKQGSYHDSTASGIY
jgi:hypothetical protein